MNHFHSLKIKKVNRETEKSISILFDVPPDLQTAYNFIAGQYIILKKIIEGKEIRRSYSICSSVQSNELKIVIKTVPNGFFSAYANAYLKEGEYIDVGTPEGKFTFEPKKTHKKNYLAFVAGSGISPVMSILGTILEEEPLSSFVLVYGNRQPLDTIFKEELETLQQQYAKRFFVYFVYSQTKINNALFGRINDSVVNFILKNKHKEMVFDNFFLCGPEDMIDLVSNILKEINIEKDRIKFELFTPSKKSISEKKLEGHTTISVLLDQDQTTFIISQKTSILESVLKQGLDAPYSCQGGICSSCLAKVTSGTAEMKKNSILSDKEIADGLILTCQAFPTSSEISIDYDDL